MSLTIFDQINYQNNYKIGEQLELSVAVRQTYQGLSADSLFSMALRVNKKRQFLFVSKLIAKHLAVHPSLALGTGTLLASLLMEDAALPAHPDVKEIVKMIEQGVPDSELSRESLQYTTKLPDKTIFLGMAETATGLGHAVFQHFENAYYVHTTREDIAGLTPSFVFEEEHSHATSHKVYAPEGILEDADTIVLIDDEISTGNTLLNLIAALDDQFPGKKYKSLSILDWRNEEQRQKFSDMSAERKIRIGVSALMSGEFDLIYSTCPDEREIQPLTGHTDTAVLELADGNALPFTSLTEQTYLSLTGRFGLASSEHAKIEAWAERVAEANETGSKPLVIGIGENMYLPLRFALALSENSLVQTTTRSPIFATEQEAYPIREKVKFSLPDAAGTTQFIYNLNGLDIDKIYLIAESVVDQTAWQPLIAYLEKKAPVEWIALTTAQRRDLP